MEERDAILSINNIGHLLSREMRIANSNMFGLDLMQVRVEICYIVSDDNIVKISCSFPKPY
jgi:hypothetical protein